MKNKSVGTEDVRWDLSFLYKGINDPQITADISVWIGEAKNFFATHKGNLGKTLPKALADYIELTMLQQKIFYYLSLMQSTNVSDAVIKAKIAKAEQRLNHAQGEYLTFFDIELVALSDGALERFYKKDKLLAKHRPWIDHVRVFRPHLLTEPVESALTKRSPFGAGAWSEFYEELEADLVFSWKEETKTLTEMLHILSESKDAKERALSLDIINKGLSGHFAKYSAQNLYMVVGSRAVETRERGYANPMSLRNKASRIPDAVVDALHTAVMKEAAPLARRFYALKAQLLGLPKLAWSDRNAPMQFYNSLLIPFPIAVKTVLSAYKSFSPALADLVKEFVDKKRIDAPAVKGKRSGAFNSSTLISGNIPVSVTLLNYLGSQRDVMTLAHEVGHGVHSMLAGKALGILMMEYPMAYAETASVFGEMTTFNYLTKELKKKNETKELLGLIMGKLDDMMNTVVRQIGFSNFERRIHGMDESYTKWNEPKKLSVSEINSTWLSTLHELYGEDNDVFTYENTEHLWTYIPHFHNPFYVYAYAFGELLTQSIYAKKDELGARFEPLYLEMLSSGMTKDVVDLIKPFGLDPTRNEFWIDGVKSGIGRLIAEAEELSKKIEI